MEVESGVVWRNPCTGILCFLTPFGRLLKSLIFFFFKWQYASIHLYNTSLLRPSSLGSTEDWPCRHFVPKSRFPVGNQIFTVYRNTLDRLVPFWKQALLKLKLVYSFLQTHIPIIDYMQISANICYLMKTWFLGAY